MSRTSEDNDLARYRGFKELDGYNNDIIQKVFQLLAQIENFENCINYILSIASCYIELQLKTMTDRLGIQVSSLHVKIIFFRTSKLIHCLLFRRSQQPP